MYRGEHGIPRNIDDTTKHLDGRPRVSAAGWGLAPGLAAEPSPTPAFWRKPKSTTGRTKRHELASRTSPGPGRPAWGWVFSGGSPFADPYLPETLPGHKGEAAVNVQPERTREGCGGGRFLDLRKGPLFAPERALPKPGQVLER
jgi:hypothetical protein